MQGQKLDLKDVYAPGMVGRSCYPTKDAFVKEAIDWTRDHMAFIIRMAAYR